MVGSAADKEAVVFETMARYSASFRANDPREAAAAIAGDPKNKSFVVRGSPMPEALFRTNHGFDRGIVGHYMWNGTAAYRDSDHRYRLLAGQIKMYEAGGTRMGAAEIVNTTALVGQTGRGTGRLPLCRAA